jgi:hypothetical protein
MPKKAETVSQSVINFFVVGHAMWLRLVFFGEGVADEDDGGAKHSTEQDT